MHSFAPVSIQPRTSPVKLAGLRGGADSSLTPSASAQAEAADHPDAIPAWTPMKEKGVAIEDDADKSLFF